MFKILKKKELCALVCLGMCMCVWIGDECNCPDHPLPSKVELREGGGGKDVYPQSPGIYTSAQYHHNGVRDGDGGCSTLINGHGGFAIYGTTPFLLMHVRFVLLRSKV